MNAEKIPTIPAARSGGCIFSLVKLAVLALAIIAAIAYFALSYTGYVADYALKTITKGTGIDAGVGSVSFSLSEQKCDVKNFYITNPPNYPEGNAVEFKTAYVDADIGLSDILAKKLVKVEEVRIEGLKISYDMKTKKGLASLLSSPDNNRRNPARSPKEKGTGARVGGGFPKRTFQDNPRQARIRRR